MPGDPQTRDAQSETCATFILRVLKVCGQSCGAKAKAADQSRGQVERSISTALASDRKRAILLTQRSRRPIDIIGLFATSRLNCAKKGSSPVARSPCRLISLAPMAYHRPRYLKTGLVAAALDQHAALRETVRRGGRSGCGSEQSEALTRAERGADRTIQSADAPDQERGQ